MIILGISAYYHDSAIAILQDDGILFALQEERLSRIKGDSSFPKESIRAGLEFLSAQCWGGGGRIIGRITHAMKKIIMKHH